MNRRWSRSKLATSLVLAAWAGLFWFVIFAERTPYYFSSRTTWLAPVGAITLTLGFIGTLASARGESSGPLRWRDISRLTVLVAPAVAIMALPPATLGTYAVAKRSSSLTRGGYVTTSSTEVGSGDLSLLDIFSLSYNGELHKLASRAGSTSSFVGFVSRDAGDAADEFNLNRFLISCCPGDAVNIQLRVVGAPPGRFEPDDWVRVTGNIYPLGKEVIVDAAEIEPVPKPKRPYLSP